MRAATVSGDLDLQVVEVDTPRMIRLSGSVSRIDVSRPDCAVSIEIWSHEQAAISGRNE